MSHFIKRTVYVSYILPSTETHFFSGKGGPYLKWGAYLQILSLRKGDNSKGGAYLKMGANSSIYVSVLLWLQLVTANSCNNRTKVPYGYLFPQCYFYE